MTCVQLETSRYSSRSPASLPFLTAPLRPYTVADTFEILSTQKMFFVISALVATFSSAVHVQASPLDPHSLASNSGGLAQVITECTVSGTAALTFDDV